MSTAPSFAIITSGSAFEIQFFISSFALLGRHEI